MVFICIIIIHFTSKLYVHYVCTFPCSSGVDYRLLTHSIEFKRRNAAFEVKTIDIQLLKDKLSEGEECLHVVLECRPKDLTGCYPPTATVCIQGN